MGSPMRGKQRQTPVEAGGRRLPLARLRGMSMREQTILAAGLMSIIVMVSALHAPIVRVVIGATLACGVYFWRGR